MRLGGSLPRSIDAARLGKILRLTQPQIIRLLKPLRASAPEDWPESYYSDQEFCAALVGFIAKADGLAAYQSAAAEVDAKVAQWILTLDACVFRELTQHFFDDAEFREIFPDGEAAEIGAEQVEAVGSFLAAREEWVRMAEFAWAVAVRAGNAAFLTEAVANHEKLGEEVEEIMGSLEDDGSEAEPEVEEAATAETQEPQAPEAQQEPQAAQALPEPPEIEEAVTLLNQIRAQVNQLDAKALEPEELDDLSTKVSALRGLAETLKHRRRAAALIGHINEMSASYERTIAAVDAGAAIESLRERLSQPVELPGTAEAWLEALAERLGAITRLDGEIHEFMRLISVAASENDLAVIEKHTAAAHECKTAREEEVSTLQSHLGRGLEAEPGAEADPGPAANSGSETAPTADAILDHEERVLEGLDDVLAASPEDKRRERREDVSDGTARFRGETYPLKNWSARGFCLGPCVSEHKTGDRLDIEFSVPLAGHRLEFSCRAVVLRVDPEKQEVAGIFATVDEATRQAIDDHFGVDPELGGARSFVERVKSTMRGPAPAD
jgi:hypothetical protein